MQNMKTKVLFFFGTLTFLLFLGCAPRPKWVLLSENDTELIFYLQNFDRKQQGAVAIRHFYKTSSTIQVSEHMNIQYNLVEKSVILDCKRRSYAFTDTSYKQTLEENKTKIIYWKSENPEEIQWNSIDDDDLIKELLGKSILRC
jgi:hypothetical protein